MIHDDTAGEREAVMSAVNGHRMAGPAVVAGALQVVLLRYRPGVVGVTEHTVHLVPLPAGGQAGAAGVALCGALLRPDLVETVSPGQGMPCNRCMINNRDTDPPATPATALPASRIGLRTDPLAAAGCYRAWDCPPPALMIHPDAPEHRVMLAAERHSMASPYPRGVHRTTGALPLPPTVTPRGPLNWVHPPQAGALRLCREFEVFAALRTALRDPLT